MGRSKITSSMNIMDAIEIVIDQRHKQFLMAFMEMHVLNASTVQVIDESENKFELIVSHVGAKGYNGDVEQYFLDKKTGFLEKGWHEHSKKDS